MYQVRHYDQSFHPHRFVGMLGLFIRALNWVRWRLEVFVQRMVIRYLMRTGALPAEQRGVISRTFDLDVKAERLEMERTSPRSAFVDSFAAAAPPRAARYDSPAMVNMLESAVADDQDRPMRPKRINDMIAKYGGGRDKRYARLKFSAPPEGEFEPLDKDDTGGST